MSYLLQNAIREISDKLQIGIDNGSEVQGLRESRALLRVLANIAGGMSAQRAFGSPGDWGYDTPLGDGVIDLLSAKSK